MDIKGFIKKIFTPLDKIVKSMDTDGDGIISKKEAIKGISVTLSTILAMIIGVLLNWLKNGVVDKVWDFAQSISVLTYITPIYIVLLGVKKYSDDNDNEKKTLENTIIEKDNVIAAKTNDITELKNTSEIAKQQLRSVIQAKNQEIEWLDKGYIAPSKRPTDQEKTQ